MTEELLLCECGHAAREHLTLHHLSRNPIYRCYRRTDTDACRCHAYRPAFEWEAR